VKKEIKKAVALSYTEELAAPKIVASGKGEVAENILEEAKKHDISVYKDEKLATLLTELEVGDQIPEELYDIVAKILVFIGDMDELYGKTKRSDEQKRSWSRL
jgi:flagellar biosynthesis protein